MKKNILVLALLLTLGMSSTFANNAEGVSDQIINSFKKDFTNAQDVQWERSKEYAKVTFKLNDQIMFAFYGDDGHLIAVTRNLLSSQLPINLLSDIKRNYSSYWISDLFEIALQDESSYYITLESGNQTLILKSTGANGWQVFKKEKKEVI
jgi:hypothetical protein